MGPEGKGRFEMIYGMEQKGEAWDTPGQVGAIQERGGCFTQGDGFCRKV